MVEENTAKTARMIVRIEPDKMAEIEREAARRGITTSALIRAAVLRSIGKTPTPAKYPRRKAVSES